MRKLATRLFAIALCLVPCLALAQEIAGRMLTAVGDVAIARGGQRLAAAAGTPVRAGDSIVVGAQSSAQLWFTDESVVSLRPATTFTIAEYALNQPGRRAFFDLVRGGLRTITGLIGRGGQDEYRVRTKLANVGIRGTSYALLQCEASCFNTDGSAAPDGTYGAVIEGVVAISNQAGEFLFGADQYFYVASSASPPQRLLAPPSFLVASRVRATAQAARDAKAASAAAAASSAQAAGATSAISDPLAPTPVAFQVTSTAAPQTLLAATSFSGTAFYRLAAPFDLPGTCTTASCGNAVGGEITLGVNHALQRGGLNIVVRTSDGQMFNLGSPVSSSGFPISVVGNQVTFSATYHLADFPTNSGAFRCSACGPNGTLGFYDTVTITGTIVGTQAHVTFTGTNAQGTRTYDAVLPAATPPNSSAGAIVIARVGGGSDAASQALWQASLDAQGRLLHLGSTTGRLTADVGTATNTIVGTAPAAGNLVWGFWTGGGSRFSDSNFNTFTSGATQRDVWITGDITTSLPPSLGTLTFLPVGSLMQGTNLRLNNASITADFVNRMMRFSVNATNIAANNTFQADGTTGFSPTTGRFSARFDTATCTGTCVPGQAPGGTYAGFFSGRQAEGVGLVFTIGFGQGTGVTGAIAFGRAPGSSATSAISGGQLVCATCSDFPAGMPPLLSYGGLRPEAPAAMPGARYAGGTRSGAANR